MTPSSHIICLELARRSIASILLAETSIRVDTNDLLTILSEIIALVILKTLRISNTFALHSNRSQINIFDVIKTLPLMRLSVPQLLEFLSPRQARQKYSNKIPVVLPSGRSLIKSFDDEEEDEEPFDRTPRPAFLSDIYPPFPRPYTFRRTETRGIRESDRVLIAKAKAEQQRQVEGNLYRLLSKTNSLRDVVNYEDKH